MGRALSGLLLAGLIIFMMGTVPAVLHDASAQDGTPQPGIVTLARVRIENRGAAEAVPVSLEAVASGGALPVQVVGVPQVAMGSVIQARVSRQQWEYQSLSIAPGVDPALALNTAGTEGWETTGVAFTSGQATVILMKRPR